MFRRLIDKHVKERNPSRTLDDIRKEVEARYDAIAGDVAARFSRGNTSIQQGAFQMDSELKRPLVRNGRKK